MTDALPRVLAAVSLAEIERNNRLLADCLGGDPQVTGFFAHPPTEMAAVARHARVQADRAQLAAALTAYQQRLGAAPAAVANARLLADPATPVVTVGQQPCLLTGPLYTPIKALTAINLARQLSAEIGRPVVPVFWIGADDDDRAEVDHCACWDRAGRLHTVRYPAEAGTPGQLVGDLPAGPFGAQVLAQMDALLEGQPHAAEVRDLLHATLAESADFGEWFARLLARLLSEMGLVLCDPRQPEVRRLAAEVLRREIAQPLATTAAVNGQALALRRQGYRPALTKPDDVCNFFLLDGERQRVTFAEGRFHAGAAAYTGEELLAILDAQPERLAPNAVLRPVVQEYLFGSAAFIAGPNELCYWAELRPVFDALQVAMPPVLPRAAATLVPQAAVRQLEAWQVEPLDLLLDFDHTRLSLLEREEPQAVTAAFAQSRAQVEHLVAGLVEAVAAVDATLGQSALATHQRMLNELERLEHKTLKAVERRSGEHAARLEKVQETLFPGHGLQERALNIFCALARYGPTLPTALRDLLAGQEGKHLFIEV